MPGATEGNTSKSGIRNLSNGESVIPSSTRADGSVRKEIRVKPGYRPPEDVEVYKNRTAEAWKNRGKGGVPGADTAEEKLPPHKAAAAKNLKRKEARKKAAAAEAEGRQHSEANPAGDAQLVDGEPHVDPRVADAQAEALDPEEQAAKEARKLAKKLRQARELKDKKEKGDNLLPEQFEKVVKISELIRQLDKLGFDSEGEKKAAEAEGDKSAD
ncbi:hypothetical protein AC579_6200 [Pseudocercospora musae]|uniref:WIBG Mago-binding domain-containing protein n=1 Tax=Pseudocercospora musae TaxID=113226 RepID=A0A139I205_9PEZI|nr:hypothetical protein AC579_6200 [Pseudocercospora musae]